MTCIAIVGNASGGKSTLARRISAKRGIPYVEIDCLLWQEGWVETPQDAYEQGHAEAIAGNNWVIDGLGRLDSLPARLSYATDIVLIDMPLWTHFWLAAERQIAWAGGAPEHTPGGLTQMPPTQALLRAIWEVEQTLTPKIRTLCAEAERRGRAIVRLENIEELDAFAAEI